MGYIAGLFRGSMTSALQTCQGPGPWGGMVGKNFDVEPRGEQKVMSNSPSVPLGGAAAWEPAGYCYDWSHEPIAMKRDTW